MPVTVIPAPALLPRLKTVLAELDQLATDSKLHRGTNTRLDSARDALQDLIAEVSE